MHLTYCGNVHPATDVESWLDSTARFAVPLATRQEGLEFGLGTWWNAATAATLCDDPGSFERVRGFLATHGLRIWTVNAFPFGAFHGEPVKTSVYEPDWSSEERVEFTRHVAEVAGRLGSDLDIVPISTLPLGYRPDRRLGDEEARVMARNLVRAASHLAAVEESHGQRLCLALEPEPWCLLETVAETAAFLETWVFREGGWTVPEGVLRRHLGVCIDLCHLAVLREDPIAALADLRARGIACPKVQVSACLELRDPSGLDELLLFDESTYLHQTVGAGGARALDLSEVAQRRAEFVGAGVLRTHFHTPVFWDAPEAPLGSTRAEVERFLRALPGEPPLLEVETYTWGVLPGWVDSEAALRDGLHRELTFVRGLCP